MKARMQAFLRRFSFRTGVIVLVLSVPRFIISFAQMALPICVELKGGAMVLLLTLMAEHKADIESRTRWLQKGLFVPCEHPI